VNEWARQWTILEHEMFCMIQGKELMNQAWCKSDKQQRAPRLMKKIDHFNRMSRFFATSIVRKRNLKDRINIVKVYLNLAQVI
jgi:hypothetical protein